MYTVKEFFLYCVVDTRLFQNFTVKNVYYRVCFLCCVACHMALLNPFYYVRVDVYVHQNSIYNLSS